MTTAPITIKKPPSSPGIFMIGIKVAIVVRTPKMTGVDTSDVPSTAACSRGLPISSCAKIRSPTTMASSTKIPITKMNAMIDMVLMAILRPGNTARVPSRAIGMPAATHNASRNCRNNASTISTKTRPLRAFFTKASKRSVKSADSSFHICTCIPSGSVGSSSPK